MAKWYCCKCTNCGRDFGSCDMHDWLCSVCCKRRDDISRSRSELGPSPAAEMWAHLLGYANPNADWRQA